MSNSWIHSFAVTDTQTHKNGYTIYKITSIVFPRAIPKALTCITVWKRFHDIKRLHRELSRRQKSFKISDKMPEPTDSTYFKRFDANIIQRRKEFIVEFLDFIAQHPPLYKCHLFFQFFNDTGQETDSPLHKLHTEKVKKICPAPEEDQCLKDSQNSTNNPNILSIKSLSDTDTIKETPESIKKCDENDPTNYQNDENNKTKSVKSYLRFLTPMASIETEDYSDYIYEAALEFSRAVQAEANLEYSEAHMRYKRGVEVLINGSELDINQERKLIAKNKILKYLARVDDIYEKFLCTKNDTIDTENVTANGNLKMQFSIDDPIDKLHRSYLIERPLNQLAKYKVKRILGERVIQVHSVTDRCRPTYVIKGIEKPSSNSPTQTIFLPQHVPYMVDLLAFFQSEQKVFLLLRYAEGLRLIDYLQNYKLKPKKITDYNSIFPKTNDDGSSEECEEPPPTEKSEHSELLRSSQRLLLSVSKTLENIEKQDSTSDSELSKFVDTRKTSKGSLPEVSIKQWARELYVAIESLHEKGVILGDLHIENLLIGNKGQLLLSYFYQNQAFSEQSYNFKAKTDHFVAPESLLSFKSDWWSYGVILYQLLLGCSFKTLHPGRINIYGFIQYPESIKISDCARDLLDNLLKQSPEERLDSDEIREHKFFEGTNWDEVRQNGHNNL